MMSRLVIHKAAQVVGADVEAAIAPLHTINFENRAHQEGIALNSAEWVTAPLSLTLSLFPENLGCYTQLICDRITLLSYIREAER